MGQSQEGNDSELLKNKIHSQELLIETPFALEWIFGRNPNLPIINLTKNPKDVIVFFVTGHTACIYCCEGNCLISLMSHIYEIISLDSDKVRRFIVTADSKTTINIWDTCPTHNKDNPLVIHSIHSPFDDDGIRAIAISADARYLVAGNGKKKCCIKIWLWTYGNDTADGTINLPSRFGMIKRIKFNTDLNQSNFFVATFTNGICFGEWDENLKKLKIHIPERSFMNVINDSIYIEKTRKAISITDTGHVIIWSDTFPDEDETEYTNNKEFVKSIKLSGIGLTAVEYVDGVIIIADETGQMKFYDKDLKLLYYSRHFDLDVAITNIIAHRNERRYKILDTLDFEAELSSDDVEKEIIYEPLMPRDFSVEENPLIIRDFLIGTADGRILSVNFIESTLQEIYHRSNDCILNMEFHPVKDSLIIVTKSGNLVQYDGNLKKKPIEHQLDLLIPERLRTKQEKEDAKLMGSSGDSDNEETSKESSFFTKELKNCLYPNQLVTCFKFSKNGAHLMLGTDKGCLYSLDPDIISISDEAYRFTYDPIKKMSFSDDSRFLIYSDAKNRILLLYFGVKRWSLIGKNQYHHKPICDFVAFKILSTDFSRLISVGEDMHLVEYDLDQSIAKGRLEVINSFRYEQSSVPSAVALIPPSLLSKMGVNTLEFDSVLLIADKEMKIKLIDCNTGNILFTYLGPLFGGPVTNLKFLTKNDIDLMIFTSGNKLGMYLLPIDGNPFRSIGVTTSPNNLQAIAIKDDASSVFTFGSGDYSCSMWSIHELNVTSHFISGGYGLDAYCSLLPGGKHGYLFQEMLDMFYYIQIISLGVTSTEQGYKISESIDVKEIVDFMRGIGFFPTDFQIRCMVREMELRGADCITFEQLIKLYLNHKPVCGTRIDELEKALIYFVKKFLDDPSGLRRGIRSLRTIHKHQLVQILTDFAEAVDQKHVAMCLIELFGPNDERMIDEESSMDENELLQKVQDEMLVQNVAENLLGICMFSSNNKEEI